MTGFVRLTLPKCKLGSETVRRKLEKEAETIRFDTSPGRIRWNYTSKVRKNQAQDGCDLVFLPHGLTNHVRDTTII